jgi:hypothetical protein
MNLPKDTVLLAFMRLSIKKVRTIFKSTRKTVFIAKLVTLKTHLKTLIGCHLKVEAAQTT